MSKASNLSKLWSCFFKKKGSDNWYSLICTYIARKKLKDVLSERMGVKLIFKTVVYVFKIYSIYNINLSTQPK